MWIEQVSVVEVTEKPELSEWNKASFDFINDFTKNVIEKWLTDDEIWERVLKTELAFQKVWIKFEGVKKVLLTTIWQVKKLKIENTENIKEETYLAANNSDYNNKLKKRA